MISEDLSMLKDGKTLNENEVATVTTHIENITVFKDDFENIFHCEAEPDTFDIGTITPIDELIPADNAPEEIKAKILAAAEGR